MVKISIKLVNTFLLLSLLSTFTACGSGGNGEGSGGHGSDSASLDTSISPEHIVERKLAFVNARFNQADYDDLDTQGLTLKLLVPTELVYVQGSATITLDTGAGAISPLAMAPAPRAMVNSMLNQSGAAPSEDSTSDGDFNLYVISLPASILNEESHGSVQLTFEVTATPASGVIFSDIDRVAINSFDVTKADFDAEEVTFFVVEKEED